MKETWTSILQALGVAWWVEVHTETPKCIYFFGPFATSEEAVTSQYGYLEDLNQEGAQGIQVFIKRCRPIQLTIEEKSERNPSPVFSN